MSTFKRLPESEFEIMKAVWNRTPPVTTPNLMEDFAEKHWKPATVISFLLRLTDKGFLRTEKAGKERLFYPLISQEEYLRFETGQFLRQYHNSSFSSLVHTLYENEDVTQQELADLLDWAKRQVP